jgi:hypothetical protein
MRAAPNAPIAAPLFMFGTKMREVYKMQLAIRPASITSPGGDSKLNDISEPHLVGLPLKQNVDD